ncbi:MAG: hypothetical protein ACKVU1_04390 [bacterium]
MYQDLIRTVLGCDALRAAMIEEQMRCDNGGVLDHLSKRRFAAEAIIANEVLNAMATEYPDMFLRMQSDAERDVYVPRPKMIAVQS